MTHTWITHWAFDYRDNGVIAVDIPDELIPENGRLLRLPREILSPWRGRDIFLNVEVSRWYRSEGEAKAALKKEIERSIRKAKRDLSEAQKHLADLKVNGLPMAPTVAERKAERERKAAEKRETGR